jgi:hypothetical protein
MYKKLAAILGTLLILCTATAWAQKDTTSQVMEMKKVPSSIAGQYSSVVERERLTPALPDLTITSARVTGAPWSYGDLLFIPLQITAMNQGAGTNQEFNVGATGRSIGGNAYGFVYIASGESPMSDSRPGISVMGLAKGASKTVNGFLILRPQPITQSLNPGTRYEITAQVDYNLDPDASYYEWGVDESNEGNNELVVNYP